MGNLLLRVTATDLRRLLSVVPDGAEQAFTIELKEVYTNENAGIAYTLVDMHPKAVDDVVRTKNRRDWLRFTRLEG